MPLVLFLFLFFSCGVFLFPGKKLLLHSSMLSLLLFVFFIVCCWFLRNLFIGDNDLMDFEY